MQNIKTNAFIYWIVALTTIVAAQRFTLPGIYSLACVIPLALSLIYFNKDVTQRNTHILVAILLSVDNSGDVYTSTPMALRYAIYLIALACIVSNSKLSATKVKLCSAYFLVLLIFSTMNFETLSWSTAQRDIVIAILFTLVFSKKTDTSRNYGLNQELLALVSVIYLLAEAANYRWWFNVSDEVYLNYNSTKSFIVFGTFYFLTKGRFIAALIIIPITLYVLIGYGTRMIPLSFLIAIIGYSIFLASKSRMAIISIGVMAIIGSLLIPNIDPIDRSSESTKVTNLFTVLILNENILNTIRLLDPVRFDENTLFFKRNPASILIGDGIGTGLKDEINLMSYIDYDQSAFTRTEIDSKVFHGLHDVWTDIGLRFGVVFVLCVFYFALKNVISKSKHSSAAALLLSILLICAFFTTAGLLAISLIAMSLRHSCNTNAPNAVGSNSNRSTRLNHQKQPPESSASIPASEKT